MQHHGHAAPASSNVTSLTMPPRRTPDPLIVGLYALRLAKRLIEGLEYYPGRDADLLWIEEFLAPYHHDYALANISGQRRVDYLATYPEVVGRMIKQPRYPVRFMQLNPDYVASQENREAGRETASEMTDDQRLEIIDFCDAANEWGSVVPIPVREAERMIELADQRRIADVDVELIVQATLAAQTGLYHEERRH